jgi:hypothetical protein
MTEPITMAIGLTIAKGVFRLVFPENDTVATVGEGLIELISKSSLDYNAKKSAGRQFERIADKAAEALIPFIENEWRYLPNNEKVSSVLAASSAISNTDMSLRTLSAQNYDPARLYAIVSQSLDTTLLSSAGEALSHQLARQSCQLIIDLSSTFPAFDLETYREILTREASIIEAVDKIFGEFDKIREFSRRASDSFSDTYFEDAYRKAVGRELDIIELFGVDTQTRVSSRHHNLTAAYISLSVSGMHSPAQDNRIGEGAPDSPEDSINTKEFSSLKVEQAVFGSSRIVMRGDAGSGKTTLLQSLAVRCATASFSAEMSQWNDLIPFFIRLRALGASPLPSPENFPRLVAPSIAGTMPDGCVHRQLQKGRALLLIDGLDEITSEKRDGARNWIRELVGSYPDCRVIVTSRPAVVSESWLKSNDFSHMDLMPMSPDDVNSFIDHWHDAVQKEEIDIARKEVVSKLPPKLKERIRGDRALRELASTPLLCAMLCAMNRDKREVLPATRIALYDAAVSMILHGRDEQRRIKMQDLPDVDYDSKFALLQEIALWMMENNWSMADKWRLTDYIETIIRKFPRLTGYKTADFLSCFFNEAAFCDHPLMEKSILFTMHSKSFFVPKPLPQLISLATY